MLPHCTGCRAVLQLHSGSFRVLSTLGF
ncbi:MAG: hypothetical protein IJL32_02085 [Oscillospiraceae bacterium]|nr:hypothetical protein [Oscillospiraceae bacterium]